MTEHRNIVFTTQAEYVSDRLFGMIQGRYANRGDRIWFIDLSKQRRKLYPGDGTTKWTVVDTKNLRTGVRISATKIGYCHMATKDTILTAYHDYAGLEALCESEEQCIRQFVKYAQL